MATLEGIEVAKLGHALSQVSWSEGITIKQLSMDSGVHERIISGFYKGEPISAEKIYAVIDALDKGIAGPRRGANEGIKTPADLIKAAEQFPEITHASVDNAIKILAESQALSLKEVTRRTRQLRAETLRSKPVRLADFETDYYAAKALGCDSIGQMLVEASQIDQYSDKRLIKAVETLRIAKNITARQFASDVQLSENGYHYALRTGGFSAKTKTHLLSAFGLEEQPSLKPIFDEVKKLEPLPDRAVYGASVRKLRMHKGISQEKLAKAMECNVETLKRIEGTHPYEGNEPSSGWLRKIPAFLDCTSMQQVIDEAARMPEITHLDRLQTKRHNALTQVTNRLC